MTAAVMLYALVVGLLLAVTGLVADGAAGLARWPRRWLWTALLVAAVGLPAAGPWRPVPAAAVPAAAVGAPRAIETSAIGRTPPPPARLVASVRARIDATATAAAQFDSQLAIVWLGGSVLVALVLMTGHLALARRRRRWPEALVHGTPVLIAPATGPAVVGLVRPRIVLPAWSLDLDPRAMALVLRHEREHVRARDPWLIHAAGAALVLMPWNPVIWWMASRLRLAVELDCDRRVIGTTAGADPASDAVAYGEVLLTVLERRPGRTPLAAPALIESSSILARRISALFPAAVRFATARVALAVAGALALTAIAVVTPVPRVAAAPLAAVATFEATPAAATPIPAAADAAGVDLIARAATDAQAAPESIGLAPTAMFDAPAPLRPSTADDVALDPVGVRDESRTNDAPGRTMPTALDASVSAFDANSALGVGLRAAALAAPPADVADARARTYRSDTPGLVAPAPVRMMRPRYTNAAMRERIAGRVLVEAVVGTDGRVVDATVIESLDAAFGLDEAAIDAVRQSVFRPGSLDGAPVPVAITMELAFAIH